MWTNLPFGTFCCFEHWLNKGELETPHYFQLSNRTALMIELTRSIILVVFPVFALYFPSWLHQWLDLLSQTPQINKCLLIVLTGSTLVVLADAVGVSESASATKSSSFTCKSRHSYLSTGLSGLLLSLLADTVFVIQSVMGKKKKMMTAGTSV